MIIISLLSSLTHLTSLKEDPVNTARDSVVFLPPEGIHAFIYVKIYQIIQ